MSKIIERASQFPKAPYYVIGTDTFMSGWGPAEGKTNVVVLPCQHSKEANIVLANAEARSEMKHVRRRERYEREDRIREARVRVHGGASQVHSPSPTWACSRRSTIPSHRSPSNYRPRE